MNEEKIIKLKKQELIELALKQKRQIEKLKKQDSVRGTLLRLLVSVPLILSSRLVPESRLETKWGSADLLVLAGVLFMFLPQLSWLLQKFTERSKK